MTEDTSGKPVPGIVPTILCVLWVLAVAGAYCAALGSSMLQYARSAAGRFPVIERLLELLGLVT